jgi:hypothetical protein
MLLAISVFVIWALARAPASTPPLAGQDTAPTPTPRSFSFLHAPPTDTVPTPTPAPVGDGLEEELLDTKGPAARPDFLSQPAGAGAPPAAPAAALDAPGSTPFSALAAGSWSANDEALRSDGGAGFAEPWLAIAAVPGPSFAIEADVRFGGLAADVCGQSFGLTGGSSTAQRWYGGGIHFPCDNAPREARLTDVTIWQDGYNADPPIAQALYDPGDGWHTYRFELRGDRIRLIVDGIGLAGAVLDVPFDAAITDGQAGLWTQGAAVEVRRLAVYPLPLP